MKRLLRVLVVALPVLAAPAFADDGDIEALLDGKRCVSCHHRTEVLIGPPYAAIAARHAAGREWIVEVLAIKIIVGGAGNWGTVPMVPNEHVTIDEARAMARWILGLAQPSE